MAIIKTLDINDGELFVTSGGQRRELAEFNGWIDISEDTVYVPILGVPHKGQKRIRAAVILCGDVNYKMEVKPDTIHSGNVYSAVGTAGGHRLQFDGLQFADSDPVENKLIFDITDYRLIEKLMQI